jgi:peptidoglycan/xylan/chitin deacetylase (PgdA/CDA1 family)
MTLESLQLPLAAIMTVGGTYIGWQALHPAGTLFGPVHRHGDRNGNRYAITFDDGPTIDQTDRVLDALGEAGAKAAFFVIGQNVRRYPDLVARMHREGHLVGNHSFDHIRWSSCRLTRYWDRQVAETDKAIVEVIGKRPAMFRPPLGVKTPYVNGAAMRAGQAVVTWTQRARDGVPTANVDTILRRLVPHARGGDVLLLHDGTEPGRVRDASATVACVRPLVKQLRDQGLEPAALDELLNLPAYQDGKLTSSAAR